MGPLYRSLSLSVPRINKSIANSGDCKNQRGPVRLFFQFLTDRSHMRIDRPGKCLAVITPDCAQKFIPRDDIPRAFHKVTEQLELTAGEIDALPVSSHLRFRQVNVDRSEVELSLAGAVGKS